MKRAKNHDTQRTGKCPRGIHQMKLRLLSLLLAFLLVGITAPKGFALEPSADGSQGQQLTFSSGENTPLTSEGEDENTLEPLASNGSIAIVHSNDVHCSGLETSESAIGYAGIAEAANEARSQYGIANVTLVDAGDAIQGKPIGTLSEGGDLVSIMNQAGYDVAALGNHEFDYGMDRLFELQEMADYEYVCANMQNTETGELVFKPYTVLEYPVGSDTVRVAYVGITTPTTLTATNPTVFENAAGNLIYSFYGDSTGDALYNQIQSVVNDARSEEGGNADYVVALSHLGASATSSLPERWTSTALVAHTTGIDAVIDGHTHLVYNDRVPNANGQMVAVAQAGTAFEAYGTMVITPDNTPGPEDVVSTITRASADLPQDESVAQYVKNIEADLAQTLNEPVGSLDVFMQVYSPNADGAPWYWTARMRETNLGDFVADAYRKTLDADIGFVNGGGIRWNWDGDATNFGIRPGILTYGNAIDINPFANSLSVVELDGLTILNALEFSVRQLTPAFDDETEANGGFLQVSGISFKARVDIPSPILTDDNDNFIGISGDRRVFDVMVNGEPLDVTKTYRVASITFLLDGGSGYTMLRNSDYLVREASLDYEAIIKYIQDDLGGTIGAGYTDPAGAGRIELLTTAPEPTPTPGGADGEGTEGNTGGASGTDSSQAPNGSLAATGDHAPFAIEIALVLAATAAGFVVLSFFRLRRS